MMIGAAAIREKYTGHIADTYDQLRADTDLRKQEEIALSRFLSIIGHGRSVLDIPVGTGWLLQDYHRRGMAVIGMDVSGDMLRKAREKMPDANLRYGDILDIPLPDRSVDAAIAIRIMPWLTISEMQMALTELARVSRQWIVTGGGRGKEQRAICRSVAGFTVADDALIDRNARGDYELVLLGRC